MGNDRDPAPPVTNGPSPRTRPPHRETLIAAAVLATLATSVPAQEQFDELGLRGLPRDTDFTLALAMGDVDGDGDLDAILGNSYSTLVSLTQNRLYLNNGAGTFADATQARLPPANDNTSAVALGDIDGDGDLDLFCGNVGIGRTSGQQNRLYLNDGSGTFSDVTAAPAAQQL